jgi:hypothetical protein
MSGETQVHDRVRVKVFGVLMAGALLGVLGILPYAATLLAALPAGAEESLPPLWVVLGAQVLQALVLLGAATALGLWLGPKVGLGAPLLTDLVRRDPGSWPQLRSQLVPSVTLGVVVGLVITALDHWVFVPSLPALAGETNALQPPAWQGLLASFYGAVPEELLLRLGLMTLLVWIGARLTRVTVPGPVVGWTAVVVTALVFGAGHLPATVTVLPLTPLVVARALLLNGIGGVVFGWLYWRRSLLAAMMAHFSADLVLHVAVPALS